MTILKKLSNLGHPIFVAILFVMISVGVVAVSESFGAALPQQDALVDTFLASGIDEDDLSMTLADGTTRDGEVLMGYYCFTVDNNTPQLEYICGTASSTAVTSLSRGVMMSDPTATSSELAHRHRRFASVQVTDFPFNQLAQRLLNGTDGFEAPLKYDGVSTSTIAGDGNYLASVAYVNQAAFDVGSIVQASETTGGFVELALGTEAAASTLSGSVSRLALSTAISTSTAPASGSVVPITGSDGNLDQGFLPTTVTQNMTFSGTSNFTGTSNTFTGTSTMATTTIAGFDPLAFGRTQVATTTTGVFTVPVGVTKIKVKVYAAGGGASGASDTDGDAEANQNTVNGTAGNYAQAIINVTAGDAFTHTIGAAGTGASAYSESGGNAASATTFIDNAGAGSFTMTVNGGPGGRSNAAAGTISGSKLVTGSNFTVIGGGSDGGKMPNPNNSSSQTGETGGAALVLIEY